MVHKKRMTVVLVGCFLVFGGVFGFIQFKNMKIREFFANRPKPVITVTAQDVRQEVWRDAVPAVGVLRAVNGVSVTVSMGGLVEDIRFESGQKVNKGDLLLHLDTSVEEADLNAALAQANLARITADRQRALIRSNTVSQASVDQADAQLKVALAQADSIRAQIERKIVLAPFSGLLGVRQVDLGQYLQPGSVVVSLQNLSVMLVDFAVSQRDLDKIALGGKLRLTTDARPNEVFYGEIEAIEPKVNAQSGMIAVRGRITNDDERLRPGMLARIDILEKESRNVLTVPITAITYNLYGNFVYAITPVEGEKDALEVSRVIVTTGARTNDRVVLDKGIRAGTRIVTSGQAKLQNGSRVKIVDDSGLNKKPPSVLPIAGSMPTEFQEDGDTPSPSRPQ